MAIKNKTQYGLLGMFLGGPIGAIAGLVAGHLVDLEEKPKNKKNHQAILTMTIMILFMSLAG